MYYHKCDTWDNDTLKTMINHPSNCPIPLVSVSGIPGTEKLSAFLATQSSSLIDHGHLNLQDPFLSVTLVVNRDTKTDQ